MLEVEYFNLVVKFSKICKEFPLSLAEKFDTGLYMQGHVDNAAYTSGRFRGSSDGLLEPPSGNK